MLVPRLLATLLSIFIVGIGFKAVVTAHYYARSGKLGMEVTLNGPPAVAMGLSVISLGFLPLILWVTSKRYKVLWGISCIVAAIFFYFAASFFVM